jgi:hypothetical protein
LAQSAPSGDGSAALFLPELPALTLVSNGEI